MTRSFGRKSAVYFLFSTLAVLAMILIVALYHLGVPPSHGSDVSSSAAGKVNNFSAQLEAAEAKITALQGQIQTQRDFTPVQGVIDKLRTALAPYQMKPVASKVGDISISGTILFDANQYVLTKEAKQYLDNIFPAFATVLIDEKSRDVIKEIRIAGYTNPENNIENNFDLSQRRSLSVLQYILNPQYSGLTQEQKQFLIPLISTEGFSEMYPVINANGSIDEAGSRRVEFCITFFDRVDGEKILKMLAGESFEHK